MQEFTCEVCGKIFKQYIYQRRGKHITCNRICFNKIRGKIYKGIPKPNNGAGWNRGLKCPQWSGNKHPRWTGGRHNHIKGYITIYVGIHPCAYKGYMLEHKFVMEQQLGRCLTTKEKVHHLNGNKKDNRIENLELVNNQSIHMRKFHNNRLRNSHGQFI